MIVAMLAHASAGDLDNSRDHNWHQWRGPYANGIAPNADPPLKWDAETNIRWKAPIPGAGSATPIIWEGRIFVLSARETDIPADGPREPHPTAKTLPPEHKFDFIVTCLNRQSGEVEWQQVAIQEAPHEGAHNTNSYASASPTTDGERLYVSFGSRGIFCFDLNGQRLWNRDLGDMRTRFGWGEGASPAISGDYLIVNWDHEDQSFITALDAKTGEDKWRLDRDEPTSWSTPVIVERDGVQQVIVNATNRVRSYELETGRLIWECGGQTINTIPTPVVVGDVVYCASGYRGAALYALPLSLTGELTADDALWTHSSGTPYVPTPIVVNDRLYMTSQNTGAMTCLNATDGSEVFGPERLPDVESVYASPIAAAGRLYFVGRTGTTVVLEAGAALNVLAINALEDAYDASPVAVGNQLFLRGTDAVYCIEESGK
jgi:outer membrane protein assembly factor BamB